jgi:hypothetical protein
VTEAKTLLQRTADAEFQSLSVPQLRVKPPAVEPSVVIMQLLLFDKNCCTACTTAIVAVVT